MYQEKEVMDFVGQVQYHLSTDIFINSEIKYLHYFYSFKHRVPNHVCLDFYMFTNIFAHYFLDFGIFVLARQTVQAKATN